MIPGDPRGVIELGNINVKMSYFLPLMMAIP